MALVQKIVAFLEDPNESESSKWVVRWQFRMLDDEFYEALARAITTADDFNLAKLALGFPVEVAGYLAWTRGTLGRELRAKGVMD